MDVQISSIAAVLRQVVELALKLVLLHHDVLFVLRVFARSLLGAKVLGGVLGVISMRSCCLLCHVHGSSVRYLVLLLLLIALAS